MTICRSQRSDTVGLDSTEFAKGAIKVGAASCSIQNGNPKDIQTSSIGDPKRRTVLRPTLPVVVEACRRNARVPEPLLNLGDVRLVLKRVGRGRRAERVDTEADDVDLRLCGVLPHHAVIDRGSGEGLIERAARIHHRSEQGTIAVFGIPGSFEILGDSLERGS